MCFGWEDLLSKGTQQAVADWHLTVEAWRKESWWEVVGRINMFCWHMGHRLMILYSVLFPCLAVTHLTDDGKVLCQGFFPFFSPDANKNDLLCPDKNTQNILSMYALFVLLGRCLIIYLIHRALLRLYFECIYEVWVWCPLFLKHVLLFKVHTLQL